MGVVTFKQEAYKSKTTIKAVIVNLDAGQQHAIHVHEQGNCEGDCGGAHGHYNPKNKEHGGPDDDERHVGDLGNMQPPGDDGVTRFEREDQLVELGGNDTVIHRSIVIHEGVDDLGKGEGGSKVHGNAGARVACGTIFKITQDEIHYLSVLQPEHRDILFPLLRDLAPIPLESEES